MPEIIVKLGDRVVQKYLLYKNQKLSIGRAPDNDIAIENPAVSRRHATIEMVNGRYILEDNNSANGSYVNGVRVTKTEILDKDVITVGKHKLHFYNQDAPPVSTAQPVIDDSTMVVPESGKGPEACLRVGTGKQKGQAYPLSKIETRIGRAADNDIRLHDWFVSKHHAVIGRKGSTYILRDLDSWRHTTVNGQIITEAVLKHGDEVKFGPNIEMTFDLMEGAEVGDAGVRKPVELGEQPPQDQGGEDQEAPVAVETEAMNAGTDAEAEVAAAMATEAGAPEPVVEEPVAEESAPAEEQAEAQESGGGRSRRKKRRKHHDVEAEPSASPVAGEAKPEEAPVATVSSEAAQTDNGQAASGTPDLSGLSDEQRAEVAMWEKALANPSSVIRKQAVKKLKQLTGRDYDIQ